MKIEVKELLKPELHEPLVVCGLPGSGYVGKMAADHLIKELKAKLFAELYCDSFPAQVLIRRDGAAELVKNELYYYSSIRHDHDLIIYTGDSQPLTPESEYQLSDYVLDICRRFGAKKLFTMAAYMTGTFVENPKVYGTATSVELLEDLKKNGVIIMSEGGITGMNGILIGIARIRDMHGICLLGETSGYIVDPKASQAVLQALLRILNLKVDLTTLEERARETETLIKMAEEARRRAYERSPEKAKPTDRELGYIS